MTQSLAEIVRADRQRRQEGMQPQRRAAADSLYVAKGNPRSPAAQALAEEAGKRLGLPPMLVDDAAMEQARVQKNMEALSQAHRTAGWISDPNNAAVAHDQVESLTGIEGLLSVMRSDFAKQYIDGPRQIAGGVYEAIGGSLYGLGLTGERALDRFGLSESARQASRVPGMAFLNAPAFLQEVGARNRRAASYLRGEEGSERALSAGVPDALPRLNYDRGFVGDVEAGLGQIGGQVLMHVGSGGMASLPTMFGQGVTQMDERVQEAQAREGRTEYSAKDDAALAAGGVVTALTEKLGLDAVIGALPAPIRSRLTSKIVDIGVAGLTEGISEAAEGAGQNAIARYVLGEDMAILDGSLAYEGGVGATVGSLARALVLTAVPGRQHSIDAQRAERAKSQHETFDAAVQAAVQNPLRERSPERFASFLREAAAGGSEVYVPAEAVATFFQSNPDLDVWMDEWDIRDQVEEALAAGTDVVFDQATYLAKVAPTAAHAAWSEDLRHGIDGMSKREAADFDATGEERLTGEIDAAIDQAQAEEAQVAPERQVRDAIFSQLREAGYTLDAANTQATIAARTFASLAERNPEVFADAMAAYQDASLTIRQDFPEVIRQSMDRIDAMIEGLRRRSARPTDRRLFGRSMMEFLAQRGGVIDTGGELAALGVDSWHRPSQGGKAFRRRFIRDGAMGGNEFAPDLAAQAAVEAGYLPEGSGPNELFAAISDELAGRPVYSQAFETDIQSKENADALDELERLLADLGIDPTTETDNAKIKAALERAAEPLPGDAAATYDQAAPALDDDRNLVAVHNLSEANLLNVAKVGGLAVPSMAVVRGDHVFPNFGEITLVAPPSLVDPKENKAAKVFGADVYSPRYPRAELELDPKARKALEKRLKPSADALGEYLYLDKIEEDGLDVLDGQYGTLGRIVRHAFLAERGDPAINAEGDVRAAIETRIGELRAEFDAWRESLAEGLVKRERIFDGYTASGRRKYLDHNLDNVVKILKRSLRDGENWNYGVGSIRSKVAPQFRSLKAIKAAKDRLVSPEEMEALKEEADQALIALGERLEPKLKWSAGFGYLDLLSEHLKEVADTRRASSLDAYYDGLTDDDRRAVVDLLERLRTMPTEYFEAKIQRAVGLDEFVGAVVPTTISDRARKVLEDAGLRVVEYDKGDTQAAENAARVMGVQAFREDTFFQSDTPFTGPRGQISLAQGRATITLFQSRDLSTFFHEFGHLTLEMLIDVASHPKASAQTKADLQTILDWFSREAGETITVDNLGVDQHELWARGTERYLMEGKAPSLELREVFRTVAAWLKRIYSTVLALDAPITDDVRAVMDRLLASDAEIAQARQVSGQETGVDVLRQQGMTDAEAAAYEKAVARARSDAESDLLGKVMGAIRRRVTKEWNDAAEEIRPEITAEVDAMPDIAAIEFITTTRTPLDRETVVAMLGDEAGLSLLPKRVPPIFSATGGQHPDMVAEAAGYRSGQELLNGLMDHAAEKKRLVEAGDKRSVRQARIEERVREELLDRFGDVLNDGSIEQEAIDAIHSERYGDILAMDLAVLARKAGQQPAPIDALRAWARDRVGSRPVREARPGRYLRAERSASTAVQKALAAGDRDEAFRQKQAQVINNVLYVEAGRAERFAEAAINRMRKLARGKNPSIHVDYMEQIDAILEQYELKEVSGRTVQRRKSLAAFKEEREAAGEPVNIPAEVLASLDKTNLADLTVDELRGLDETVKHLVHLGRMKTTLIVNGERRELDRLADQAWAAAGRLPDVKTDEAPGDKSAWERITGWGANFEASLVKAQEYFRLLQGGHEGVFSDVLDKQGQAAADERVRLQDLFWSPVIAAKNAIPAEVQNRWMDVVEGHPFINPNTGQPIRSLKRRDLVGAALHVGNLSNFEKLAKGYGLVSKEADAMAVSAARQGFIGWLNERLDASEWAYVQAIWDAHERLRPVYFAAARKVEGFEPDPVEPDVVNTPAGPLKGGYVPIAYHRSYDASAQRREQREAADMFGGVLSAGPRPDNGATNARTTYVGAVRLGLDDARYLAETHITYAAYAEYVTNALKFIRHPLIAQTIKTKLGQAAYDTMEPWIAGQVRDEAITDPGANPILRLARGARSNMTAAVLMGSVTVLLAQPGGLAQSTIEIGPKAMTSGALNGTRLLWTDNLRGFITSRSEFMRLRVEQGDLDRDFRLAMQQAKGAEGLREKALVLTGKAIALVDFYLVSAPTWLGAYDKALVAGADEAGALYAADMAVRRTQGGGRAIDQAGIQRANEVTKMLTFAYGWANAYYNMQRGAVVDLKNGEARFENAIKLAALLILPALLDAALSGDWPEPGETVQETISNAAEWFARNVFFGAAAGVPVLRDAASTAERKAAGEYAGAMGQTPLGRTGDAIIKLGKDAWDAAFDRENLSRRWPSHVIQATGLVFGIPGTTQATRAVNYTTDVAEGEQNPDGPLDWMNGLMRGPQEEQR